MKRLMMWVTGLVTLTTSSYAISLIDATPKDIVPQNVACPTGSNAKAEGFQVISAHRWSQGVIILYSALCPGKHMKTTMKQVFGHKVVRRHGIGWQISGSDSYRTKGTAISSEQLIEYSVSRSANPTDGYTILYGQVLKPKVVAVEATFDNGRVLRDQSSNGVFALISPGATRVCEVRIFGEGNQILKQEEVVSNQYVQHLKAPARCLPVSHSL